MPAFPTRARFMAALAALALACAGGAPATGTPGSGPGAGGGSTATPLPVADYLLIERGTLPVVLSAPHGGTTAPPGVPQRTTGTTVLDVNTFELLQAIQAQLRARTGGAAWVVGARMSRRYADFNRTATDAYESALVAPVYAAYHAAMADALAQVRATPRALVIDLHGQGATPGVVYRGTRDGQTATLAALHAPGGFLAELIAAGVTLAPNGLVGTEDPSYNGGFIVGTYGRLASGGVDAVQLEFGFSYRADSAAIALTADRVATAIIRHLGL